MQRLKALESDLSMSNGFLRGKIHSLETAPQSEPYNVTR